MKKLSVILVTIVVLLGVFGTAAFMYKADENSQAESAAEKNSASFVRSHSPVAGNQNARVTIVEFFDPACGTCSAFHPIVKELLREHPGKINLVMRYMPLHQGSAEVVKILEAARIQGKYWDALETAYATQQKWVVNHQAYPELFWRNIASVELDPERVSSDMQSLAVSKNIQLDIEDGRKLGVTKTPGFFVNGKPLIEFGQMQLLQLVNEALEREYGG